MDSLMQKFGKRTFAAPATSVVLALMNDGAKLGFDFKYMVLMVAASLAWAAIETWRDTTMMAHGLWHRPEPPKP